MRFPTRATPWLLLAFAAACSDTSPTVVSPPIAADAGPAASAREAAGEAARRLAREAVARRLARALRDPAFRAELRAELDASPVVERKVHYQRLVGRTDGRFRALLAGLTTATERDVEQEAQAAIPLEVYFPVDAHRAAWRGGTDLLVATAATDGEAPVAWDLQGRRRLLDPGAPPATPVLAVVPVETDFDTPAVASMTTCGIDALDCDGSTGAYTVTTPGVYMTYAEYPQTFESWLKGDPEFEMHVLAPTADGQKLESKQCAGQRQTGPYYFDQNEKSWAGEVLLFSQTQLDAYKQQYPGKGIRVVAIEDDDAGCQLRFDPKRAERLFTTVDQAYGPLTAGVDSTTVVSRAFKRAAAIKAVLAALASLIKTNDELIGQAIEDVVAQAYNPLANWVVKDENNLVNGWLKLEMR